MKISSIFSKISARTAAIVATIMLCSFAYPAGSNWNLPGGAKANFSIDGMLGINVNGTLTFTNATVVFDPANPQAGSMNVSLSVASIATGINKRDRHLKTSDYFDVDKYPSINFRSSSIQKDGNNFKVTGDLKIKAVTKSIAIPFSFSQNGAGGTFKGNFTLKRSTYGIGTGNETGMGNEVRVKLDIPVKKG